MCDGILYDMHDKIPMFLQPWQKFEQYAHSRTGVGRQ